LTGTMPASETNTLTRADTSTIRRVIGMRIANLAQRSAFARAQEGL